MDNRISGNLPMDSHPNATPNIHARQYAWLGFVVGLCFPIAATMVKIGQAGLPINFVNTIIAQRAESLLWIIDTAPFVLSIAGSLMGMRQDRFLATNNQLQEQSERLIAAQQNLEKHVAERTQQLELRNSQTRAAVYFSRQIAELKEIPDLLDKSVGLITQYFGLTHAAIYLIDEQHKTLSLQTSSSRSERINLERAEYIEIGDPSPVGRAASSGKPYTHEGKKNKPHDADITSHASESLSEIALPLLIRRSVVGVLDAHSEQKHVFDQSEVEILQLLADQIAVSMENVRLLSEARAFNTQLQMLTSQQTNVSWQEYLGTRKLAYQFTLSGVRAIPAGVEAPKNLGALTIPILLRGQKIGSIQLRRQENPKWAKREQNLAEKVATQVALALDNSRLIAETRERALREQTVGEISSRLSRSLDLDTLLQTAVRELGALPDVAEVSVFIAPEEEIREGNKRVS